MKQGFRRWKKGKHWLYASTALAVLTGGAMMSESLIGLSNQMIVYAQDIVNGTEIGRINGKPVIQSNITNMETTEFQLLVDSIIGLKEMQNVKYVADTIQWTGNTRIVASGIGNIRSTLLRTQTNVLNIDGFTDGDQGKIMNVNDEVIISDVGSMTEVATGRKIPLHLKFTYLGMTHGADGARNDDRVGVGFKSQSGVITIGFTSIAPPGAAAVGGQTENGGATGPGGISADRLVGYIDSVAYSVTLVNAETLESVPNEEIVMAMKVSDVDAKQKATLGGNNALGYIVSNDTRLGIDGNGLVSRSSEAFNEDTTRLSANSYVILKNWNTSLVDYRYTDGARDHMTLVTGLFGNVGFNINPDNTGTVVIQKSGEASGTTMWNNLYSLEGHVFRLTNRQTGATYDLRTDATGQAMNTKIPFAKYWVEEISTAKGFRNTFVPHEITLSKDTPKVMINGKEDQVVTVKATNSEYLGQIIIQKSGTHSGTNMWNSLYSLEGNVFTLTHKESGKVIEISTDKNGRAVSPLIVLGRYLVEEKTASKGFQKTFKPQEVLLSYDSPQAVLTDNHYSSQVNGTNDEYTGEIIIEKTGLLSGTNMWNQHYSLAGNTFTLTHEETKKEYTLVTDATGRAKTGGMMPLGGYDVVEIKSSDGFANTFQKQKATLTQNGTLQFTVKGTNTEIVGQNTLSKVDSETGKTARGKATLANAQYALFYAEDNGKHKADEPVKWTDTPHPTLLAGEKVVESVINGQVVKHGDNIVVDVDDALLKATVGNLKIGRYYWKEVNAPTGYGIDAKRHEFTIAKADDKTTTIIIDETESKDNVLKARISIQKILQASGDMTSSGFNGITFTLTPLEGTKADKKTFTTASRGSEDGYGDVEIEYGDWVMTENDSPQGYAKIVPIYIHMTTDEKTDIVTITASHEKDGSNPFSRRTFVQSDDDNATNSHATGASGVLTSANLMLSLSRLTLKDNFIPPQPPKSGGAKEFQPEKFVVSKADFDIKGTLLLDDDDELKDRINDTAKNPYVDKTDNNEAENLNTKVLKRGDTVFYQVWLDTTSFDKKDQFSDLGIVDTFDVNFKPTDVSKIKVYDKETGNDVTKQFDLSIDGQKLTARVNNSVKTNGVIDTRRFSYGRYYKIVLEGKIADDTPVDVDILNTAEQFVSVADDDNNPNTPDKKVTKKTQTRVNKVTDIPFEPHKFVLNSRDVDVTGDSLLDDDSELDNPVEDTAKDPRADKIDNNEKANINTQKVRPGQVLTYQLWLDTNQFAPNDKIKDLGMVDVIDTKKVTVADLATITVKDAKDGKDVTKYFDMSLTGDELTVRVNKSAMKTIKVDNKDVLIIDTEKVPFGRVYKIEFDVTVNETAEKGKDIVNSAKQLVVDHRAKAFEQKTETRVNDVDEPGFTPHKFVLSKEDVDITGNRLLDDDSELSDRYVDTAKNPYVDKVDNNEAENINTKLVDKKQALTYQLWVDMTQYNQKSLVTELGMSDDFDEAHLVANGAKFTIRDGLDGKDVTEHWDIVIKDGVLTFKVKDSAMKKVKVGDKEVSVVDTAKLPFGRFYKAEFTLTVADNVKSDTNIQNVARQFVRDVNGQRKELTTETRVNRTRSDSFLPYTGEEPVMFWTKIVGWSSLIGAGIFFVKRKKSSKVVK